MHDIATAVVEIDDTARRGVSSESMEQTIDVARFESLEQVIDLSQMAEAAKPLAWMYAWSKLPVEDRRDMVKRFVEFMR